MPELLHRVRYNNETIEFTDEDLVSVLSYEKSNIEDIITPDKKTIKCSSSWNVKVQNGNIVLKYSIDSDEELMSIEKTYDKKDLCEKLFLAIKDNNNYLRDTVFGSDIFYNFEQESFYTLLERKFLVLKCENCDILGLIKKDGKTINTFEMCNFEKMSTIDSDIYLNIKNVILPLTEKNKIDIEILSLTKNSIKKKIVINNAFVRAELDSDKNDCFSYRLLISDISVESTNEKYIPYSSFKNKKDWKKDRIKYIAKEENIECGNYF